MSGIGPSTVANLQFRIRKDIVLSIRSRRRPRCGEDILALVVAAAADQVGRVCCQWQLPTLNGMVSK